MLIKNRVRWCLTCERGSKDTYNDMFEHMIREILIFQNLDWFFFRMTDFWKWWKNPESGRYWSWIEFCDVSHVQEDQKIRRMKCKHMICEILIFQNLGWIFFRMSDFENDEKSGNVSCEFRRSNSALRVPRAVTRLTVYRALSIIFQRSLSGTLVSEKIKFRI